MIDFKSLTPHCPPADTNDISEAEAILSVTLPNSYKEFVKQTNGVYLSASHPISAYPNELSMWLSDNYLPVSDILGVNKAEHRHNNFEINSLIEEWGVDGKKVCTQSIFDSKYLRDEWNLPDGLILLSGDGHFWIALDYRHVAIDPPVIFIESELGNWCKVADNFALFLKGVIVDEDD